MQKAVPCSAACLFPLHRDSFVLYLKVIYLPDCLTFWKIRHRMFRLACPVNKSMFPKELVTARGGYAPGTSSRWGPHTGSPGTLLASRLQTVFLLPFCLAALCIVCSAAVSAVPVFLEGLKAFLRVMWCAGMPVIKGAHVFRTFPTTRSLRWAKAVHLHLFTLFGLKG